MLPARIPPSFSQSPTNALLWNCKLRSSIPRLDVRKARAILAMRQQPPVMSITIADAGANERG
jgi:hypothetical protein